MQRSKIQIYMVWATHNRHAWLTPEIEKSVHRCITSEAVRLGCVPLGINGMPDHVHFVVQIPSTIAIARLAQAVKGVSSKMVNARYNLGGAFDWQDNYGAFSVGSELEAVLEYVRHQKQHHAQSELWEEWEETAEFSDSMGNWGSGDRN